MSGKRHHSRMEISESVRLFGTPAGVGDAGGATGDDDAVSRGWAGDGDDCGELNGCDGGGGGMNDGSGRSGRISVRSGRSGMSQGSSSNGHCGESEASSEAGWGTTPAAQNNTAGLFGIVPQNPFDYHGGHDDDDNERNEGLDGFDTDWLGGSKDEMGCPEGYSDSEGGEKRITRDSFPVLSRAVERKQFMDTMDITSGNEDCNNAGGGAERSIAGDCESGEGSNSATGTDDGNEGHFRRPSASAVLGKYGRIFKRRSTKSAVLTYDDGSSSSDDDDSDDSSRDEVERMMAVSNRSGQPCGGGQRKWGFHKFRRSGPRSVGTARSSENCDAGRSSVGGGNDSDSDDDSSNDDALEKYAAMRQVMDESDRDNESGGLLGCCALCCGGRCAGCCDSMLGERKTRRRKMSIAVLACVLILCVVVALTAGSAKKGKDDSGGVKGGEIGDIAPSPASSTPRPAAGDAENFTAAGSEGDKEDESGLAPSLAYPTKSPFNANLSTSSTHPTASASPMAQMEMQTFHDGKNSSLLVCYESDKNSTVLVSDNHVCVSYCEDCSMANPASGVCTDERRSNGAKLSVSMAMPLQSVAIMVSLYAASFTWCVADNCNKIEACTTSSSVLSKGPMAWTLAQLSAAPSQGPAARPMAPFYAAPSNSPAAAAASMPASGNASVNSSRPSSRPTTIPTDTSMNESTNNVLTSPPSPGSTGFPSHPPTSSLPIYLPTRTAPTYAPSPSPSFYPTYGPSTLLTTVPSASPTTTTAPTDTRTPQELYYHMWWDDLPAQIRVAFAVLGYDQTSWNEGHWPISYDLYWDDLSQTMRDAALIIGYTQEMWNADDYAPYSEEEHVGANTANETINETTNSSLGAANFDATNSSLLDMLSDPYVMSLTSESPLMPFVSRYGSSVAMSGDGNLVAVGATGATNELGDTSGAVYLYSLDVVFEGPSEGPSANSLSLLQVVYGQSSNGEFGNAIALSRDGNRMVVGSRSENEQTGAMWIYQRDKEIDISDDDANDAIPTNSYQSSSWSLMEGGVISGKKPMDRGGWSVSISADGNVVAMGSPKGGSQEGGSILTYKYNDVTSGWDPYGSVVQGLAPGEEAGYSIYLSATGSIMVVGFPRAANLVGMINAGKTAAYFMNGLQWQLMSQEVYGESAGNTDGTSVAMSQDGSVLVIGGKGRSEVTGEAILGSVGHCSMYQIQAGQLVLKHSISGRAADERLGFSVAVSSDGNVVACGGVGGAKHGSSQRSGVVRLWNRRTLRESTIWPRLVGANVEGASFGTSLAMSVDGDYVIIGAPTMSSANGGDTPAGAIQIFSVAA